MSSKWLTDKQLAERYGCSRTWVWQMAKADSTFPKPVKFTAGCSRFSVADADRYDADKLANQ
jgi:predicted DNA-binding transcriptional regulator AlpA